jgi:putative component of membrane protein insertase Oxa1/YidC/SpoIIIJ protein YidD
MPNHCGQDIVRYYCLHRKLIKPQNSIPTCIVLGLVIEIIAIASACMLCHLFHWFGIVYSFKIMYAAVSVLVVLSFSKRICVTLIKFYQQYASESTRRRCTLMPSCSEYALLALSKYNTVKALYKIYIRITRKCRGIYQMDYP